MCARTSVHYTPEQAICIENLRADIAPVGYNEEEGGNPGGVDAKYECMHRVIPAGKYASRFECLICQHG